MIKPMHALLLGLVLGFAFLPHAVAAETGCGIPEARDDGWQVATPEGVGIDSAVLCPLGQRFEEWKEANLHGVLVIRHSKLVYERYFTGFDRWAGKYGPRVVTFDAETTHDLRSMTKSFTALVAGAAVGRGWIKDVDQSVLSFFPEYADLRTPEKDGIQLRHLLTMSTGLDWNDGAPYLNEDAMNKARDPYRYVLALPVVEPPGRTFNYSGGATALIGGVMQKATGRRFEDLARTLLLEPLGISDVVWTLTNSFEARDWCCFHLRPRDMAKLGQLVLQRGRWNGVQVVPEAWIDAATSTQIAIAGSRLSYGYQFWIDRQPFCRPQAVPCTQDVTVVAARGQGGQRVYVVPALDLIVVTTAGLYYGNDELSGRVPRIVFSDYVLSAVDGVR